MCVLAQGVRVRGDADADLPAAVGPGARGGRGGAGGRRATRVWVPGGLCVPAELRQAGRRLRLRVRTPPTGPLRRSNKKKWKCVDCLFLASLFFLPFVLLSVPSSLFLVLFSFAIRVRAVERCVGWAGLRTLLALAEGLHVDAQLPRPLQVGPLHLEQEVLDRLYAQVRHLLPVWGGVVCRVVLCRVVSASRLSFSTPCMQRTHAPLVADVADDVLVVGHQHLQHAVLVGPRSLL